MAVEAGDVYSVASGEAGFLVAKILAVEQGVLTVRLYTNTYDQRPRSIDPSTLRTQDPDGTKGVAAFPMKPHHFDSWQPQLLMQQSLRDDEKSVRFVPSKRRGLRDLFRRR